MIFRQFLPCTAFIDAHVCPVFGTRENPTYAIIDSQSVKTTYASDQRGCLLRLSDDKAIFRRQILQVVSL